MPARMSPAPAIATAGSLSPSTTYDVIPAKTGSDVQMMAARVGVVFDWTAFCTAKASAVAPIEHTRIAKTRVGVGRIDGAPLRIHSGTYSTPPTDTWRNASVPASC